VFERFRNPEFLLVVTLHPVVAYFRNPNDENEISHKAFVYVSDELGHT
jgi:hypothetical protein